MRLKINIVSQKYFLHVDFFVEGNLKDYITFPSLKIGVLILYRDEYIIYQNPFVLIP